MRLVVVALLFTAMLAGCASESAPPETSTGPAPREVEVTKAGTGAISGVVIDTVIVPIAGANITIINGPVTQSDENGAFVFEDVAPGVYFLQVDAYGYASTQTSVEVIDGEVVKPRILLDAIPVVEPYHYTIPFQGFIQFSGAVGGGLLNIILDGVGQNDPTCTCNLKFSTGSENVTAFVYEAVWDSTLEDPTPFCPDCLYASFSDDNFNGAWTGFLGSPILHHMPREQFPADSSDWDASLTGNGYWVNVEQTYEMFITVFSNAPPPEGWSIVAGS